MYRIPDLSRWLISKHFVGWYRIAIFHKNVTFLVFRIHALPPSAKIQKWFCLFLWFVCFQPMSQQLLLQLHAEIPRDTNSSNCKNGNCCSYMLSLAFSSASFECRAEAKQVTCLSVILKVIWQQGTDRRVVREKSWFFKNGRSFHEEVLYVLQYICWDFFCKWTNPKYLVIKYYKRQ